MNEKELMFVKGNNGRLLVFDDYVYFERKSFLGNLDAIIFNSNTGYYNEKKISYEMINGIEWGQASTWRNGYISLAVEGEIKNQTGHKGAGKNATSIVFFPKSNDDAANCVAFISKKVEELKKEKDEIINNQNTNNADELIKYKKMLDDGIITEEEFLIIKERIIKKL